MYHKLWLIGCELSVKIISFSFLFSILSTSGSSVSSSSLSLNMFHLIFMIIWMRRWFQYGKWLKPAVNQLFELSNLFLNSLKKLVSLRCCSFWFLKSFFKEIIKQSQFQTSNLAHKLLLFNYCRWVPHNRFIQGIIRL